MNAKNRFENLNAKFQKDPGFIAEGIRLRFYESIIELMEQIGMTRAELARRLDCQSSYVSRIFNDSANLSITSLARIAIALDCELKISLSPKKTAKSCLPGRQQEAQHHVQEIDPDKVKKEAIDAGPDYAAAA